jgi:chromosome segregation protein
MFLKSLVVRGFKSFADKTTLAFEPGISVVVGPNGSGKSNIVDAISWVLGEQGVRSLRGGKMEDVIFAGSRVRPALGMAEVTLTIDNSAGLLPIEFTEVEISRLLFRSGESEYRLNGAPCRLLDIQEVLSDSGVGREQHTIIGQGQLDQVLHADPVEMRAFIEEAAGIAKHRRRKERAVRKIASAEGNLVRLGDLLAEIRRQLRPLREQAEVARRHAGLEEERRRIALVLTSRELAAVRSGIGPAGEEDLEVVIRRAEVELSGLEEELRIQEDARSGAARAGERARETSWGLARAIEHLRATGRLASEREKTLSAQLEAVTDAVANETIRRLESEREGIQAELDHASARQEEAQADVAARHAGVQAALGVLGDADRALEAARVAQREAASEAVSVRGEVGALTSSLSAAEHELARSRERAGRVGSRRQTLLSQLTQARAEAGDLEAGELPLGEQLERLEEELGALDAERTAAQARVRTLEREAAEWRGRAALRAEGSADTALRLAGLGIDGVLGVLGDLVEIPLPYRRALDALAGAAGGVLVARDAAAVERVLDALGDDESVAVLVATGSGVPVPGVPRLLDRARCLDDTAAGALADVYMVDSLAEAARLAAVHGHAIFVTPGGGLAAGRLATRGRLNAAERAEEAQQRLADAEEVLAGVESRRRAVRTAWEEQSAQLNELDATISAATERVSILERELHGLERELEGGSEAEGRASESLSVLSARLAAARERLPGVEAGAREADAEVNGLREAQGLAQAGRDEQRARLDEARMGATRAAERRRLLQERMGAVDAGLVKARRSAEGVADRRRMLEARLAQASAVTVAAVALADGAEGWSTDAETAKHAASAALADAEQRVAGLRSRRVELAASVEQLRERERTEGLQRTELRIRGRILEERLRQEFEADPDETVSRYGHIWEVEDLTHLTDPTDRAAATEQEALLRRLARLERDLAAMGRVNPLAAQEFELLTQREEFLAAQMADVRASKRDLLKVVETVDERIRDLFASAFNDVAREYERLFVLLFPGGSGRMRLTDLSDPLGAGVEVDARPGGKNVRRLSLLSGGERSLAALAVLFAIFRARPSPFYVLDEVEAALDDVNLHRFLELLREFRDTSQLLVVTHQKRTMEIADCLYGVSVKPDGASRVLSERLPDPRPELMTEIDLGSPSDAARGGVPGQRGRRDW